MTNLDPYALIPGQIYGLECDHVLSKTQLEILEMRLSDWEKKTGCKFIIIDLPLKLVKAPVAQLDRATDF